MNYGIDLESPSPLPSISTLAATIVLSSIVIQMHLKSTYQAKGIVCLSLKDSSLDMIITKSPGYCYTDPALRWAESNPINMIPIQNPISLSQSTPRKRRN